MAVIGGTFVLICAALVAVLFRAAVRDPSRIDSVLFFVDGGRDSDIAKRWEYLGRGLFFLWAVMLFFGLVAGGLSLLL